MNEQEQRFMRMIQLRKEVINSSMEMTTDERFKACDKTVLFYLDRIEEDFKRAFGYTNE